VSSFAARLLAWFAACGRHDLPWQRDPTPYRVWVSEIMLQQTQVQTVIPYFERFLARFPTLESLAAAEQDEVLGLWSGLGYYARARNLHRAATELVAAGGTDLPDTHEALVALPGIGRSTASAILALSRGVRAPILDGNVKRVLARYFAIERWPGEAAVEQTLWAHAESLMPADSAAEYTQAIMDLGATLCTKRQPACARCPVAEDCRARARGIAADLPAPRPKRTRPTRRITAVVVVGADGVVRLERRAEQGVWGGLYSFPELGEGEDPGAWAERTLGARPERIVELETIAHAFTHFDLELVPREVRLGRAPGAGMDRPGWLWYNAATRGRVGIAAPIAAFLDGRFDDEREIA
jgi:A/G-specific adenine glycosylase